MNSLISGLSLLTILSIGSCKDFDEVNTNPTVASKDQVRTEYLINQAIITAQQDPHIAERAFVRYWKNAGHQQREGSLTIGATNNDWSTDYYIKPLHSLKRTYRVDLLNPTRQHYSQWLVSGVHTCSLRSVTYLASLL